MRVPALLAASLIAILPAPASAYDPPASLKTQLAAAPDFSGVILVDAGDGKPFVWTQGTARGARPITPGTRFDIASMGKLITATAVMQMVEQGKIDLDAPIGRYLPEFAAPARDKVTVAMLLNHTGGLDEILFAPQFRDRSRAARDNHELYLLSAGQPNAAAANGQPSYSNTGFIVLGEIVARASGAAYEAHIRKAVLEPAGMSGATFMRGDMVDAPDIAMGYLRADADPHPGPPDGPPPTGPYTQEAAPFNGFISSAAGGLYASAQDLAAFGRALSAGKLISKASFARMCSPLRPEGPGIAYGYGCVAGDRDGVVGHSGGRPGMQGQLLIQPRTGLIAVVLSNRDRQGGAGVRAVRPLFRPI